MGTLFQGGTIVTAGDVFRADLLVEGQQIAQVGLNLPADGHQIIDCGGQLLLPGGVDVHTHFDLDFGGTVSSDNFFTGGRAAAFGGTTTHIDFANQWRGGSLGDALAKWQGKATGRACIDYSFHLSVTDARDDVLAELPALVNEGLTSLKVFTAYKGVYQLEDRDLYRVMRAAAAHGMIVLAHAENGDVIAELVEAARSDPACAPLPITHAETRPAAAEAEATNRLVALAGLANCPLYVVHVTCAGAVEAIRRGRADGVPVMGETCPQYLFLSEDNLRAADGAKFVCSPPLRTSDDQAALWQALRDDALQAVATDHCPFWYEGGVDARPPGKERGRNDFSRIPNGLPAVEERLKLLYSYGVSAQKFDLSRFVALTSTNPAKIFGLYPRKGALLPGSDADIVVWDVGRVGTISAQTHHMRVDYSAFEGMTVCGGPSAVFLRGAPLVSGDDWLGSAGGGQFIRRAPGVPHLSC